MTHRPDRNRGSVAGSPENPGSHPRIVGALTKVAEASVLVVVVGLEKAEQVSDDHSKEEANGLVAHLVENAAKDPTTLKLRRAKPLGKDLMIDAIPIAIGTLNEKKVVSPGHLKKNPPRADLLSRDQNVPVDFLQTAAKDRTKNLMIEATPAHGKKAASPSHSKGVLARVGLSDREESLVILQETGENAPIPIAIGIVGTMIDAVQALGEKAASQDLSKNGLELADLLDQDQNVRVDSLDPAVMIAENVPTGVETRTSPLSGVNTRVALLCNRKFISIVKESRGRRKPWAATARFVLTGISRTAACAHAEKRMN